MNVDVMAVPVVKTIDRRSARRNVDMNPTIAAKSIAGPKFLAGGNAYIMTARKIKASATDFWLWGTPSAFVTGTVKRLDAMVRISSATNGPRPVHPDKGKLSVANVPRASKTPPRNVTTPRRLRLFPFLEIAAKKAERRTPLRSDSAANFLGLVWRVAIGRCDEKV